MEQFTVEETERLNKILSVEVNPYLSGESGSYELPLGKATEGWLFTTHMNLPADAKDELRDILSNEVSAKERIFLLNEFLEERQINSAPKWWELEFFEFSREDVWEFVVEQCRRSYSDPRQKVNFDFLVQARKDLNEARHIISVSKLNKTKYSEAEIESAIEIYDQSYPLDFKDYEEVPGTTLRSPLAVLQYIIADELSDVGTVFTKRWFEFKILDELASYELYLHDSQRDSSLSKKIGAQLRGFMQGRLMSLGRMVEHYRWKFSYEEVTLRGIQTTEADKVRGQKGGDASGRSKRNNIECLLDELESLGDLFPRMSEDAIFEQAYSNASKKRKMPKSRKTIDGYSTIIKSEDLYRHRYNAIFRKNA